MDLVFTCVLFVQNEIIHIFTSGLSLTNMRKVLYVFFLFSFFTGMANAQDRPDVLETCKYFEDDYHKLVERMLLPDSHCNMGFICRPSWSGEQSVYLEKTDDDRYKLVMHEAEENIWYAARNIMVHYEDEEIESGDQKITYAKEVSNGIGWNEIELDMKIDEKELEITTDQVTALYGLFRMAIYSSAPTAQSIGFDGETIKFFFNDYAAECWSPEEGKLKRLVDITKTIKQAIKKKDNTMIEDILPEVGTLTQEFHDAIPDWGKENLDSNFGLFF